MEMSTNRQLWTKGAETFKRLNIRIEIISELPPFATADVTYPLTKKLLFSTIIKNNVDSLDAFILYFAVAHSA